MRPSWSEYFLEMAALVAKRSTCLRRQVGAVAVKDGRIIATGYNGAPVDFKHCQETGCLREQQGVPSGQRHRTQGWPADRRREKYGGIHGRYERRA